MLLIDYCDCAVFKTLAGALCDDENVMVERWEGGVDIVEEARGPL